MSLIGLDTPDFLPGPQLGQGFVQFGRTINVPASSGVVDGPWYIGQFTKCWVAVTPSGVYPHDFFLRFSNDASGTHHFDTQNVDKNTSVTSLQPMDVLGQFVYFVTDNLDVAPHNITYSIFGTNSDSKPGQLYIPGATIDVQALALGAGATVDITPQYMLPGRYRVWAQSAQAGTIAFRWWNSSAWSFSNVTAFAVSPGVAFEMTMPTADWEVELHNASGVASSTYLSMNGPY